MSWFFEYDFFLCFVSTNVRLRHFDYVSMFKKSFVKSNAEIFKCHLAFPLPQNLNKEVLLSNLFYYPLRNQTMVQISDGDLCRFLHFLQLSNFIFRSKDKNFKKFKVFPLNFASVAINFVAINFPCFNLILERLQRPQMAWSPLKPFSINKWSCRWSHKFLLCQEHSKMKRKMNQVSSFYLESFVIDWGERKIH